MIIYIYIGVPHCGTTGLGWEVSLQCQDAGLIPGPALRVKGFSTAAVAARLRMRFGSGPWPGNSICYEKAKNKYIYI